MAFGPQRDMGPWEPPFQTLSQHCLSQGEPNPPISRSGASAQQARGAQTLRGWSLCLYRSASPNHPGEEAPLLPSPWARLGLPL